MNPIQQLFTDHLDLWTGADTAKKTGRGRASGSAGTVYGIKKLRELILELAVRGKLVPQDPNDEPASALLERYQIPSVGGSSTGWCEVQLGKLGAVYGGATPSKAKHEYWEGTIPWVSPKDMKNFYIDGAEDRVSANAVSETALKIIPVGSLLMVVRGMILVHSFPVALTTCEVTINQDMKALLIPDEIKDYMLLYLRAMKNVFVGLVDRSSHGTCKIISEKLWAVSVTIPPKKEQARIVAKVDKLMALCDQLEAGHTDAADAHEKLLSHLLATLTDSQDSVDFSAGWHRIAAHFDILFTTEASIDSLKQTLLQLAVMGKLVPQEQTDESGTKLSNRIQVSRLSKRKIVALSEDVIPLLAGLLPASWSWISIDQISVDDASAITDGPFGANLKTEHYIDEPGYRVVRLQNIGHGEFRGEYHSYISETRFEKLIKHQVRGGDLIVAGLIDTTIRCCAAPENIGNAIVKADCYKFSVHPYVSPTYVRYYLNSITAQEFASVHHHGLTLTRIGLGNFRSLPVPLPPLEEQHRIVAKVDELMALCDRMKTRIADAGALQRKLADAMVAQAVA